MHFTDVSASLCFLNLVPRPGLEPGWVAPLVFETSASTDSAIWARKAVTRMVQTESRKLALCRGAAHPRNVIC